MMKDKILEQVYEMIKTISGQEKKKEVDLVEARAECFRSGHVFEAHKRFELGLTPKDCADIMFSAGRASQLGVLFGILHRTGNLPDEVEVKARELVKEKYGWEVEAKMP